MKKKLFGITGTTVLIAMLAVSCKKEIAVENFKNQEKDELIPTEENAPFKNGLENQREIADITAGDFRYRFFKNGEAMAVGTKFPESMSTEAMRSHVESVGQLSPLALYLKITDKEVPVPKALLSTAPPEERAALDRPITDSDQKVVLNSTKRVSRAVANCSDVSSSTFRSTYCHVPVSQSPTWIEYCDDGLFTAHQRTSKIGNTSYKLTVANTCTNVQCGVVDITCLQFKDGSWQSFAGAELEDGIWYYRAWISSNYSIKRVLRVLRSSRNGNKGFRSYTQFD